MGVCKEESRGIVIGTEIVSVFGPGVYCIFLYQ